MDTREEFEVALIDLQDVKSRDRMLEKVSIYSLLTIFVIYTTQAIPIEQAGAFLAVLTIFAFIRNKQYEKLEKEIKRECREM